MPKPRKVSDIRKAIHLLFNPEKAKRLLHPVEQHKILDDLMDALLECAVELERDAAAYYYNTTEGI